MWDNINAEINNPYRQEMRRIKAIHKIRTGTYELKWVPSHAKDEIGITLEDKN